MHKIVFLDCSSGISGDMMLGALVDAGVDLPRIAHAVQSLGLPNCRLVATEVKRCGIRATHVCVESPPEHVHRNLHHITEQIDGSQLSPPQKDLAKRIFRRLAEVEAKVHGTTIDRVHFHEVGAVDSIADIVGTAVGWHLLGAERLIASPVAVGGGTVRIAHGRVGVPAPATAELLKGVPIQQSDVRAELTTPTGAAILTTLAEQFGPMPAMIVQQVGYGAGTRELEAQPNVLRLFVGQVAEPLAGEQVWVVETNLDDLPGEVVGYCVAKLWEVGALDVYTVPIQMKKNRPGVTLSVICPAGCLEAIETVLLEETSTLGVRCWPVQRRVLPRAAHSVETPWGTVRGKVSWHERSGLQFAPEYESCRRVAEQQGVALRSVYEAALRAFDPATVPHRPKGESP